VRRLHKAGVLIVAGLAIWGCKTITEELPSKASSVPNPTVTVPFPVVVTPVVPEPPSPAPGPTPTPSSGEPAPTPTPTPAGGGGGPSAPQSCAPAHETGNQRCPREGRSDFLGVVESAYDTLIDEHPNWFRRDGGVYFVKIDDMDWAWAVVDAIRRKGYCAGMYAEEVSVRTSRAYSENFDVLISTGAIRRGEGAYRSTCYPASTTEE
jgi:hypothetical protein